MSSSTAAPRQAKKITVLDTKLVSLWYYPEDKIVHHQIKQFITGEPFKEFLLAGSALFEQHGAEKWLSDDRGCPVVRPPTSTGGTRCGFRAPPPRGGSTGPSCGPRRPSARPWSSSCRTSTRSTA